VVTLENSPVSARLQIEPEDRIENWPYRTRRNGSCVHASVMTSCAYQGLDWQVATWRQRFGGGGENPITARLLLDRAGLRYASTEDFDYGFIRNGLDNRLPVHVNYPRGHMQTLVGMTPRYIWLIDNRWPEKVNRVSTREFASDWGGWALAIIENPPPPM
jgi:hypothetical protein